MDILLVAATEIESKLIQQSFDFQKEEDWLVSSYRGGKLYLLSTGIGMTSTAYMLGRFLALRPIDLGINFGIAGSFDKSIELGEIVEIQADSFAELGAEDNDQWLDLTDLGFPQFTRGNHSFYNTFSNPSPSPFDLKKCDALTVNRTHGQTDSIQKLQKYWPAQVETMEGAAFFHAMIRAQIPFYAFRSISNYVEKRNRDTWQIPLAVRNIQSWIKEKLQEGAFQMT